MAVQQYAVYGSHSGPLSTGSLWACAKFIAYAMKGPDGHTSLRVERAR